jgi:hypothetical protein
VKSRSILPSAARTSQPKDVQPAANVIGRDTVSNVIARDAVASTILIGRG